MPVGIQEISQEGGTQVNVKERGIPDFMYVSQPRVNRVATEVAEEVPDEKAKTILPYSAHH